MRPDPCRLALGHARQILSRLRHSHHAGAAGAIVREHGGLRVVDGSVMPQLVAVNPNITTMLIGERAADLIRGGHGA